MRQKVMFLAAIGIAACSANGNKSTPDASAPGDTTGAGKSDGPLAGGADAPTDDTRQTSADLPARGDSAEAPRATGDSAAEISVMDVAADVPTTVEVGRDTAGDGSSLDVVATGADATGIDTASPPARVSVLEHHNHPSRDGVYVDPALTKAASARMHVDPSFAKATVAGPVYAQPLYLAGVAGGPDLVIVATEQNHVYAFDAATGKAAWDQTLGMPLPRARLDTLRGGCGNIDPLGVTGTPIIDAATRTVYLDAMRIASANATAQHQVFALDADTGAIKSGWPVDLNSVAMAGTTTFESLVQNQRGALALVAGKVYIPFGGHNFDCGPYHGWIVGISATDPKQVSAWATRALAGGVWAPGGIASDGQSIYFATGNTESKSNSFTPPASWLDGETIFRLPPSLTFSGQSADYFTPANWAALDDSDADIGGTAPVLFDVSGAKPSSLLIGLGKDGNAYLVDRTSMGGISKPLAQAHVSSGEIINASAVYATPTATYVVFRAPGAACPAGQSGGLTAIRVSAQNPPTITTAWCGGPASVGSPTVSSTDTRGTDSVVWIVGKDNKLYGLDGDTGKTVFSGGTTSDTMATVQGFQSPIVANGRIFVASNSQVYAFAAN